MHTQTHLDIAAVPQGRSLLFSPSCQTGSAVSELLIPFLLFSRNGEIDDAKELALNVISNLCLDKEGCLLFLNRKLLV